MTRLTGQESLLQIAPPGPQAYLPHKFAVGRTKFTTTPVDRHVVWFCKTLTQSRAFGKRSGDSGRRLLSFRADFRRIQQFDCTSGLLWCILHPDLVEEQRVAVWLLGRSHREIDPRVLVRYTRAFPVEVKRALVKALRRLGATKYVPEAARGFKDERLQRLASASQRDFRRILSKWSVAEDAAVAPPSRPFELFVEIDDQPHRPKPRDWIRAFLEHIRMIVGRKC